MADNVEIKLEQLTEAIRSLYSRPALSQSEINNMMTNLAQKFENASDIGSQKLVGIMVSETKKVLEEKHHEMAQQLLGFETLVKQVSQHATNPKMSMEVTKILSEITQMYTKLSNQELALQKMNQALAASKTTNAVSEILKLSNDFNTFSRGFENITLTLNKNFSDFLTQIKTFSSKEEIAKIQIDLDALSGNVNSIISALAIIDHKYQDLSGLLDVVNKKESVFNESLQEVVNVSNKFEQIREAVENVGSKEDFKVLNEKFSALKPEIELICDKISKDSSFNKEVLLNRITESIEGTLSLKSAEIERNIQTLKESFVSLGNNLQTLSSADLSGQIKTIENSVRDIAKDSLTNVVDLISAEFSNFQQNLENKDGKNKEGYELAISTLREDIRTFMDGFASLRDEVAQINKGNIRILQEPIERALKDLKDVTIGAQLSAISESVKETSAGITTSFEQVKENFQRVASSSNIEILSQLRDTIPAISDKLEIFRNHVVSENSASLTELKSCFYEVSETIKAYLEDTNFKVQEEIKRSYAESLSAIKVDLQTLSNHLIESVENVNSNISKEFEGHKANIDELLEKIGQNNDIITDKIANIEQNIETSGSESLTKITDTLQLNGALVQDAVNELKNDVLAGILGSSKNNKTNFGVLEEKINTIIADLEQSEIEDKNNTVLETLSNVEEKIERTNLQQIHNAKELMEEIQSSNTDILKKFENSQAIAAKVNAINEKIESLSSDIDSSLEENFNSLKEELNTNVKGLLEQIEELLEKKEGSSNEGDIPQVESYLAKIDEYLANVEYLKNNISEDIRECIESQIMELQDKFESAMSAKNEEAAVETYNMSQKVSNVETNIDKIAGDISKIVSSTQDTSYVYSLQDVESDIAKLRLSLEKNLKGDNYKEFINRLIELKNINLENNRLNHAVEGHITHMNNWLKAAAQKLDALAGQVEKAERMSVEEIKTRLIHSEKSSGGAQMSDEAAKRQIAYLEDLDEKLSLLLQKQTGEFDPASFIDVTYENMKQTKNLSARVQNIESKIDKIQGYMEKIVAYIEE